MKTSTYMNFGTEWILATPSEPVDPFSKKLEGTELFHRYEFPEFKYNNKYLFYTQSLNTSYTIYDLIFNSLKDTEIKIKYIFEYMDGTDLSPIEILGYFTPDMCRWFEEKGEVTITPKTLDQYTYFLDNYDNKINILSGGKENKIPNGNFQDWIDNNTPIGWSGNTWRVDQYTISKHVTNDYVLAKCYLYDWSWQEYPDTFAPNLYTSIPIIALKDEIVDIRFSYNFWWHGENTDIYYVDEGYRFQVTLKSGNNYYVLKTDGTWVLVTGYNLNEANENAIKFYPDQSYVFNTQYSEFLKTFNISSVPVPADGEITCYFWLNTADYEEPSYFVVTNFNLITSNLQKEEITIEFREVQTGEVTDSFSTPVLKAEPTYLDYYLPFCQDIEGTPAPDTVEHPLSMWFDVDNKPSGAISEIGLALIDTKTGLNLAEIVESMQDIQHQNYSNYKFYKGELSELTVYEGKINWWTGRVKVYAIAKFSRDVFWHTSGTTPPAEIQGWEYTNIKDVNSGKFKWVRNPYNGDYASDWDYTGGNIVDGETYNYQLQCYIWEVATAILHEEIRYHQDIPLQLDRIKNGLTFNTNWKTLGLSSGNEEWKYSLTSKANYPVAGTSKTYEGGFSLLTLLETLFRSVHSLYADKNVYSNFFFNNREFELSYLLENPGINYVTRKPNYLNSITCLHTSALKTEANDKLSDNTLEISIRDVLTDLKKYFRKNDMGSLYWWIDTEYNLHIEHVKYFEMTAMTASPDDKILPYQKEYSFVNDMTKNLLIYDQVNASYTDFSKVKLEYPYLSKSKTENKDEITTTIFTTDILSCLSNPNSLTNGIILLNHDGNGNAAYSANDITGVELLNGNLSLTNLIWRFGKYEGAWKKGFLNGTEIIHEYTLRNREGAELTIYGIWDAVFFNTLMGRAGFAKNITHLFESQTTKVVLLYRDKKYLMAHIAENDTDQDVYLDLGFYM